MYNDNVIEVVGAIIKDGDKYLIGQRPAHKSQVDYGSLWVGRSSLAKLLKRRLSESV